MQPRRFAILPLCLSLLVLGARAPHADCLNPVHATCDDGSPAAFFSFHVSGYAWCHLPFPSGMVTVTVQAQTIPIQKVRFTLPDPPLGTVVGESWGVSSSGDRSTVLEVDLGGCSIQGLVTIGEMMISVGASEVVSCQLWTVPNGAEVLDCEGFWRPAESAEMFSVGNDGNCEQCGHTCCAAGLPPYDLYPPDGATQVPLDVVLSWSAVGDYDGSASGCRVGIGTDPDCSALQDYAVSCDADAFAPDFLQPGTTYYWRPGFAGPPLGCNSGNSGTAPLHSFTTESPSPAARATWGRVKALYRE